LRIWDLHPGYLNRQSLLGEHRELHGMVSILVNGKTGYARHPETLRWVGCLSGLAQRHELLVAEMSLRGYRHHSPVESPEEPLRWPADFVDDPLGQIAIIREKYREREGGRIPFPQRGQELFAQHKYSVMARDPSRYRDLGKRVAGMGAAAPTAQLVLELVELLRLRPSAGGIRNAGQHMWGYVAHIDPPAKGEIETWPTARLLRETALRAIQISERYLMHSTALSDLAAWLPPQE